MSEEEKNRTHELLEHAYEDGQNVAGTSDAESKNQTKHFVKAVLAYLVPLHFVTNATHLSLSDKEFEKLYPGETLDLKKKLGEPKTEQDFARYKEVLNTEKCNAAIKLPIESG